VAVLSPIIVVAFVAFAAFVAFGAFTWDSFLALNQEFVEVLVVVEIFN
jgi:hypothetical protein